VSKEKACMTCGGTGWQWLNKSWLKQDGYRRERCGICGGTGISSYHHYDSDFVRRQRERRAALTATDRAGNR
jgi:hypothetical protein